MKLQHLILTAALMGTFAVPSLAKEAPKDAPRETPEATATRVRELEKAIVVLQEDLGRTRLQLDLTQAALNNETRTRKALQDQLANPMSQKLAELEKAINALSARHDAELAALKQSYDQRVAALQDELGKETAARAALEKNTAQQVGRLDKREKQGRVWSYILNGINLGVTLTK